MSLESDAPQIHLFPLLPNSDITCFKALSHCHGVRISPLRALNKNDKGMKKGSLLFTNE